MRPRVLQCAAALLSVAACAHGFYLPGIAPNHFPPNHTMPLFANSLTSTKTHLPISYYDLPFCTPSTPAEQQAENLGQLLTGNEIVNSPYELIMDREELCKVLCVKFYARQQIAEFRDKINDDYRVNLIVDNLPAAVQTHPADSDAPYKQYEHGYRLGAVVPVPGEPEERMMLNNHLTITILVHDYGENGKRVVGFVVEPRSVLQSLGEDVTEHDYPAKLPTQECERIQRADAMPMIVAGPGAPVSRQGEVRVVWTYDVQFQASDIQWASRWDAYLSMSGDDNVHWFSILNSVLIVMFLTAMVAMIMVRTVYRDLRRYNRVPTDEELEEQREESGWKLVHADVFRPPRATMALSVAVGTGAQLLAMACATLVFAAAGFLSPAMRGALMMALLLLFVLMGVPGGYVASRVYKFFHGTRWQRCTLNTALVYPGIVFSVFFLLNLLVWSQHSAGAVPFMSLFAVLTLWFCVSVPLVFLGAFYGFKQERLSQPTATAPLPRQVPPQPWYMQSHFIALVGGILPFGAVFVEMFFILSSLWLDRYYYVFGFLFLVFGIMLVTSIEISIVLCYFQLCGEDYRWQWRAFFTAGSSALYLFLYSAFYFATQLDITAFVPALLYFGYMFLISTVFLVMTGTVGFLSCLFFVRAIFGSVKID